MLSIQAVRGLPHLRAPGIVPCIISFSRQLLVSSLCGHSMLASLLCGGKGRKAISALWKYYVMAYGMRVPVAVW